MRRTSIMGFLSLAAMLVAPPATAQQPTVLKLSHFLGPASFFSS